MRDENADCGGSLHLVGDVSLSGSDEEGLLNCQRYVFRSNLAGGLRVPEKRIPREDWPDLPQCKRPEFPTTEDEFMKGLR